MNELEKKEIANQWLDLFSFIVQREFDHSINMTSLYANLQNTITHLKMENNIPITPKVGKSR